MITLIFEQIELFKVKKIKRILQIIASVNHLPTAHLKCTSTDSTASCLNVRLYCAFILDAVL